MRSESAKQASIKAEVYCQEGYNCAEAIFLTYQGLLAPELDPQLVRLFTAYGCGVGESGCMCGALAGAIAAINMLVGRSDAAKSKDEAYRLAKEFAKRFTDEYYVTCCRAINPHPYNSPEHLQHVRNMTADVAEMLMDFLIEKGLFQENKV